MIFKQKLHDIYPACIFLIFRSLLDPREVLMQFKGEHLAPSIDEDISSGAVVFGNPEKKARH